MKTLKWWSFHPIPLFEQKKLSFDDSFMTTWERENERKKEPQRLQRHYSLVPFLLTGLVHFNCLFLLGFMDCQRSDILVIWMLQPMFFRLYSTYENVICRFSTNLHISRNIYLEIFGLCSMYIWNLREIFHTLMGLVRTIN